jgi:hypothetical protein
MPYYVVHRASGKITNKVSVYPSKNPYFDIMEIYGWDEFKLMTDPPKSEIDDYENFIKETTQDYTVEF